MNKCSAAKVSFDSVSKDNQALVSDLHGLIQSQQDSSTLSDGNQDEEPDEIRLKSLLERLYVGICDFGSYQGRAATADEEILAVWESFFEPIGTLAQVRPHGHMMAARMVLYLTSAFLESWQLPRQFTTEASNSKPLALRIDFLIALDNALLSHLTQIWSHGDKRDMFAWVFTEHAVNNYRMALDKCCYFPPGPEQLSHDALHVQRKIERFKAACLTRPSELTPENGVRGRFRWTRPQGDTTVYPRHLDCSCASFDDYDKEEPLIMWQDIGSDGPIRRQYYYTLIDEETNKTYHRERPVLRRSRQFIVDAQKVATTNLANDSRRLAKIALARSRLPVELQDEVLGNLEDVPDHPYLSKLNLAAVYQPFPNPSKTCIECPSRGNTEAEETMKATCPQQSITIWNLPLRVFHTFHLKGDGNWAICIHSDCSGHHSEPSWSVQLQGVELEDHLNGFLQGRCGPGTTVRSIGLGPMDPIEVPTLEEDDARLRRLFIWDLRVTDFDEQDRTEEAYWKGIGGLVDVMHSGRTLLGSYASGQTTMSPQWVLGRTIEDEERVRTALMIH